MSNIKSKKTNINIKIEENAEEANEKTLEEQLIEAILKNNPIEIELPVDENGHIIIDKELYPDIYDWAVNG